MDPPLDPSAHTVSELRDALEDVDDPDGLAAVLEAERTGDDRTTAVEAIEARLRAVGADPTEVSAGPVDERPAGPPTEGLALKPTLGAALRYPWDGGDAAVTLVIGGILTLLGPLVIPAVLVLGYGVRAVDALLDGQEHPPAFGDWRAMFVDGIKAAIVLLAYVALPLAIGTALVTGIASAAEFRVIGGMPTVDAVGVAGAIALGLVLLLVGLALVVWYLAPVGLVHFARTRSLRAAFDVDDVRRLAMADAYASAWLLALLVFAATGVVMSVLYAAAIGVLVSGFVTFYAFLTMAYLIAMGAVAAEV